jgi:hypothetical protein
MPEPDHPDAFPVLALAPTPILWHIDKKIQKLISIF